MRVRNDNLNIPVVLGYRVKTSLYQPKCDRQKRLETSELLIRPLEDLNNFRGMSFFVGAHQYHFHPQLAAEGAVQNQSQNDRHDGG